MASHTSLRQAAKIVRSNRFNITPSQTRKSSQASRSHPFLSSHPATASRHPRVYSHHGLQQSRNLSWWGSGSSASSSAPVGNAVPQNLTTSTPTDYQNTIIQARSFKASQDLSSAETASEVHSTPTPVEPQIVEDVQRAFAEPHLSDGPSAPLNLEDIPERIGYLKEVCGLDFGWGPSATMQFLLEHIHLTAGLSWTASIMLLGFAVRAVILPFLIGAAKEAQKMRDMKGVIEPIQAEYTAAKAQQDQAKMTAAAQRLIAVRKEFGLKIWKSFLPPVLQIPLGFGCWRVLRNCATLPVPGFVSESWLWTTDLSFSDPYFITPAVSSLLIYLTISSNARTNITASSQNFVAILQKLLPAISFVFVAVQPGAVQLYFVFSSAAGLISAKLLQQAPVRAYFGMPPLPKPEVKAVAPPSPAPAPAASARPATPAVTGGLHRRSFEARTKDAARAAQIAAEQAETTKRSVIDRGVDSVKGQYGDLKSSFSKVGAQIGWTGKKDEMVRSAEQARNEEYEARVREKLDERRRERNTRNSIRR